MGSDRPPTGQPVPPPPRSSDNCVKNHFYARLRRALRRMQAIGPKPQKEMKPNVLYRIVEAAEEKFRLREGPDYEFALFANSTPRPSPALKKDLLAFSYDGEEDMEEESPKEHSGEAGAESLEMARDLLGRVSDFMGSYRKKGKKERRASAQGSDLFVADRYEIRCNSEHPLPSSLSNFGNSEEDEEQQPEANPHRFRKSSADCSLEQLSVSRVRTRAHSQSNSHRSHEAPTHLPMEEEDSLGIECILEGMKILENFPTAHPLLMRKETSRCSRLEEEASEEFRFCKCGPMQLRTARWRCGGCRIWRWWGGGSRARRTSFDGCYLLVELRWEGVEGAGEEICYRLISYLL